MIDNLGSYSMESNKNVLLTTTYKKDKKPIYDYWKSNSPKRSVFGFSMPRIESFGLRFIKQNVPEIEILEYPTWEQYQKKLKEKKWDIIGYSFFLNETHEILQMAEYARSQGISELWAGNYGALTPEIQQYFDKIFYGYSENQIAQQFGYSIKYESIMHPPLCGYVSTPFGIKVNCIGYLFTGRGCPFNCVYCQTPSFCKKPSKIPLHNLKKVIDYYKSIGISQVIILDENFGIFKNQSNQIVDYLHEKKIQWIADFRADTLAKQYEEWKHKHMAGVLTAIESINQETLDSINKQADVTNIIKIIKQLIKDNKMTVGFYMVGYETDTIDSIKRDIKIIAKLKMDITQLCIITPLPKTKLWDEIQQKYGIFEKDWHHFNAKHLVWNHPSISAKEMRDVLQWSLKTLYPRKLPLYTIKRFLSRYLTMDGIIPGLKYSINHFIHANTFDYIPKTPRYILYPNKKEFTEKSSKTSSQSMHNQDVLIENN